MALSTTRVFIVFENERVILDVTSDMTVKDVKELVRIRFLIGPDEGPIGIEIQDKKKLTLTIEGADLEDHWWFNDLGIIPGSTIKAVFRDEPKPTMFIHTKYNGKVEALYAKLAVKELTVAEFRGIVSRHLGLPVTIFRLSTQKGVVLFDRNSLFDYNIELGDHIELDTWDGWGEILNLSILGFTYQLMQHVSTTNEMLAKFQMKSALYIAAHFNHTDLAVALMRSGVRADEAIGSHPYRFWCDETSRHVDSFKAPVHEAAEFGKENVLRAMVQYSVVNIFAKDGNGLTPLNISLRKKQKVCASFLLTKQWSKINYGKNDTIHLSLFAKMKKWSDKAKDKVLMLYGASKSSFKNPRKFVNMGALVGVGVEIDGYTESCYQTRTESESRIIEDEKTYRKGRLSVLKAPDFQPEMEPEKYFRALSVLSKKPNAGRMGKALSQKFANQKQMQVEESLREAGESADETDDRADTEAGGSPDGRRRSRQDSLGEPYPMSEAKTVRFPPITEEQSGAESSRRKSKQFISKGLQNAYFSYRTNQSEPGGEKPKRSKSFQGTRSIADMGKTKNSPAPSRMLPSVSSSRLDERPEGAAPDDAAGDSDEEMARKMKRRRAQSIKSAALMAKARAENQKIKLPEVSWDSNPRPFVNAKNEEVTSTLKLYERHRGLTSRDYAIKCLTVASEFKGKPWLAQVQQALQIAARGVKKVTAQMPHLFQRDTEPVPPIQVLRTRSMPESEASRATLLNEDRSIESPSSGIHPAAPSGPNVTDVALGKMLILQH